MAPSRTSTADEASIILIGRFNPAIFQPAWLASHGLIREQEATHVEGIVFGNDVAAFKVDWLRLQVTPERFEAVTDDPSHVEPLRDLVLAIFGLLEHTPFNQMGLNRHLHYQMESPEAWHQFGDTLAPKSPWTALLSQPGLRSLTMEGYRSEAPHGRIQIHVEPSPKVSPGIYFGINHHFEFTEPNSGRKLMAILLQQWQVAQAFARQAAETLLNQV